MPGEPESELRAATKRRLTAVARLDQARAEERDAIAAAHDAGMRQVDIVRVTGYTREHVRRIVAEVKADQDDH